MIDDWSCFEFVDVSKDIPKVSCVYFLMNDDELVYIGQTNNLRYRIGQHMNNWNCSVLIGENKLFDDNFNGIFYLECDYKKLRIGYEDIFREDYWPKLNSNDWKNFKFYTEGWI